MPLATRLLPEGTGEIGLADPGGAGDEHMLVLRNPAPGGELPHERAIQTATRRVVEIFETGVRHARQPETCQRRWSQ